MLGTYNTNVDNLSVAMRDRVSARGGPAQRKITERLFSRPYVTTIICVLDRVVDARCFRRRHSLVLIRKYDIV